MKKENRSKRSILIFLVKAMIDAAVFSGLLYLWIVIVFSHGKLFQPATAKDNFIDLSSMILLSAAFIAFTVWLSRIGAETKEDRKNMSFFGKLERPAKLLLMTAVFVLIAYFCPPIAKNSFRRAEVKRLYSSATDIIRYPSDKTLESPFGLPVESPVILADENSKTVTFIYGEYTGEYKKLKLKKESDGNSPEGLFVQYSAPLSSGGNVTTYYSHDPDEKIYMYLEDCEFTQAVEMTDSKGEKWFAALEPYEVFGFSNIVEAKVSAAGMLSDTVIEIKGAAALDPPCGEYSFPTVFIDTHYGDRYYISTLCGNRNNTETVQEVKDSKLEKLPETGPDHGTDDFIVMAKIDIPEKDITLYACRYAGYDRTDYIDKYFIVKSDGSIYISSSWENMRFDIEKSEYAAAEQLPLSSCIE